VCVCVCVFVFTAVLKYNLKRMERCRVLKLERVYITLFQLHLTSFVGLSYH